MARKQRFGAKSFGAVSIVRGGLSGLCALLALLGQPAYALMEMSESEYALLPQYCRHQQYVAAKHPNPPRSAEWEDYFGPTFNAIHHYCWAIVKAARGQKAGVAREMRLNLLGQAVGDIQYVLERMRPDHPLRAELYTKLGQHYLSFGKVKEAEESFLAARQVNAKYWPAYFHWAFYLQRNGRARQAGAIVEEGLAEVPNAKALINLKEDLRRNTPAKAKTKE